MLKLLRSPILAFTTGFVLTSLQGCTPTMQYRANLSYETGSDCASQSPPEKCHAGFQAADPEYHLGIVEFDDQGELFSDAQFEWVRSNIEQRQSNDTIHVGKIVILFAHGWFNDASPGNGNLDFFRQMLAVMAKDEEAVAEQQGRTPRAVEGVFLAWRGASTNLPIVRFATFWNRKDTAHRVGERRATEVILRLRDAAYAGAPNAADHPNRFILMGHSFGGAVIYSATSQLIAQSLLQPQASEASASTATPAALSERPSRLADAVILFNPAFEAARVRHLLDTGHELKNRLPTLTVFTSKTDSATRFAFPAARFFNTMFEEYRPDAGSPVMTGSTLPQRPEDVKTIGHYVPFITHDLVLAGTSQNQCVKHPDLVTHNADTVTTTSLHPMVPNSALAQTITNTQDQLMQEYSSSSDILNFGESCLLARPGLFQHQMAVLNVSMDADIWNGHGLDQTPDRIKVFTAFLEHYIPFAASDVRSIEPISNRSSSEKRAVSGEKRAYF